MILVKSVEIIDSERDDFVPLAHFEMPTLIKNGILPEYADKIVIWGKEVLTEIVKGYRFTNARGETVVVGWGEEIAELLGLPMKLVKEQAEEIKYYCKLRDKLDSEIINLRSEIVELKN